MKFKKFIFVILNKKEDNINFVINLKTNSRLKKITFFTKLIFY